MYFILTLDVQQFRSIATLRFGVPPSAGFAAALPDALDLLNVTWV